MRLDISVSVHMDLYLPFTEEMPSFLYPEKHWPFVSALEPLLLTVM